MESRTDFKGELKHVISQMTEVAKDDLKKSEQHISCLHGRVVHNLADLEKAKQDFVESRKTHIKRLRFMGQILTSSSSSTSKTMGALAQSDQAEIDRMPTEPKIFAPTGVKNLWIVNLHAAFSFLTSDDVSVYFNIWKFIEGIKTINSDLLERDFNRVDNPYAEFSNFIEKIKEQVQTYQAKMKNKLVGFDLEKSIEKINVLLANKTKAVEFKQQFATSSIADTGSSSVPAKVMSP